MKNIRSPSKATLKVLAVLLLQPEAERYGYELMKSTRLPSGTLYPILMRMHDRGLLTSKWRPPQDPGRPQRQTYRLTASGLQYAEMVLGRKTISKKTQKRESPA